MTIQIKKGNTGGIVSPLERRINRHESIIYAVVIVILFMLGQLLIDSFRFSSATYKEYSGKTEALETIQTINQQLLEQNTENQEIIIDLQNKILLQK
jgi:small neutral amino acid transporter SnatA (MarC family)